jgi:hypothetical protein
VRVSVKVSYSGSPRAAASSIRSRSCKQRDDHLVKSGFVDGFDREVADVVHGHGDPPRKIPVARPVGAPGSRAARVARNTGRDITEAPVLPLGAAASSAWGGIHSPTANLLDDLRRLSFCALLGPPLPSAAEADVDQIATIVDP